jgi:hypothetical protein
VCDAKPRLSDLATELARVYMEAAGFVKLIRDEVEIDFVVAPNLTEHYIIIFFQDLLAV